MATYDETVIRFFNDVGVGQTAFSSTKNLRETILDALFTLNVTDYVIEFKFRAYCGGSCSPSYGSCKHKTRFVLLVPDMPGLFYYAETTRSTIDDLNIPQFTGDSVPIYEIENDIGDGAGIRVKRVNVYRKSSHYQSVTREYRYDVETLKHLSEIECKNVSDHAIITCLPQTIAANILTA